MQVSLFLFISRGTETYCIQSERLIDESLVIKKTNCQAFSKAGS